MIKAQTIDDKTVWINPIDVIAMETDQEAMQLTVILRTGHEYRLWAGLGGATSLAKQIDQAACASSEAV